MSAMQAQLADLRSEQEVTHKKLESVLDSLTDANAAVDKVATHIILSLSCNYEGV